MGRDTQEPDAEVIIGAIEWQGCDDLPHVTQPAEVIRLAPYLLARRGRAVAPPASGG